MQKFITLNKIALAVFTWGVAALMTLLVWTTDVSNPIRYAWTAMFIGGIYAISTWRAEK